MAGPPKMHRRCGGQFFSRAATLCGIDVSSVFTTDRDEEVTCKRCQREMEWLDVQNQKFGRLEVPERRRT